MPIWASFILCNFRIKLRDFQRFRMPMKLQEALPILEKACGKRFGDLFFGHPEDLRTNKGNVGQLLLRNIGLTLDSNLLDFEDGELKTNKSNKLGNPIETMYITQISNHIDDYVSAPFLPFVDSQLYLKIRNLVYLPVVKESSDPSEWYFTKCIHIQAPIDSILFKRLQSDYNAICIGFRNHIEGIDGLLHTTNGEYYLQARTKDSKPYHPIYSEKFGRYVSQKNFAFYFLKKFMADANLGILP
jgi:DNA mismatch repair protein MutH